MLFEIIGEDLTTFDKAKYIAHQCNCVSESSAGIAKAIFDKYPHADVYKRRKERSFPGTIEICGGENGERGVINLFAQYYPGKSKYDTDSVEMRIEWIKKCLAQIYNSRDKIESIAFPYGMGCGLGGGDWEIYRGLIKKLAANMPEVNVYIIDKFLAERKEYALEYKEKEIEKQNRKTK